MAGLHIVLRRDVDGTYLSGRGASALAVSVVLTALASYFVLIRIYTRTRIVRRMEADGWMVLVALVSITDRQIASTADSTGILVRLQGLVPRRSAQRDGNARR